MNSDTEDGLIGGIFLGFLIGLVVCIVANYAISGNNLNAPTVYQGQVTAVITPPGDSYHLDVQFKSGLAIQCNLNQENAVMQLAIKNIPIGSNITLFQDAQGHCGVS